MTCGVAHHLGRRAVGDLRPWCSTSTRSTWRSSVRHRMLDPDHGQAELVAQPADQSRHRLDLGLGQPGGHLVEQQQARPRRQRHADLEQALLRRRDAAAGSAGHAPRPISARMASPSAHAAPRRGRGPAGELQAEAHVVGHASCRRTRAASGRCARCRARRSGAARCPVRSRPPTQQPAGGRRMHARDRVEEGGLARAVRADDADQLAGVKRRARPRRRPSSPPKRTVRPRGLEQGASAMRVLGVARPGRICASRSDAEAAGRYSTRQDQQQPQHHHVGVRQLQAQRLGQQAEHRRPRPPGPQSVAAPPISAISTVWKPMKGLNTESGSM